MKKIAIHFLQFVVLLFGLFSLILLLRFPLLEGRAVNLTLFEIYSDPFILYVYLSSIAFYLALLELVKLLKYIGEDRLFSITSIAAIKKIKFCSFFICIFIVLGAIYIRFFHHPEDDPAGFMALSILLILIFTAVGAATAVFEKIIQKAVNMKQENDLTI